jgi:hypothetical protein
MSDQNRIGGTELQLAALHQIVTTGSMPYAGPASRAPSGTTVDKLLYEHDLTPDARGFINMGTLLVHEDDYQKFCDLQTKLCKRNPEARDLLFHMEHAREELEFRVTKEHEAFHQPSGNILSWNPKAASWDAVNQARVPPSTTALHEETHWAAGELADVLAAIPSGHFGDFEEKRVTEGAEARDMEHLGYTKRESHFGNFFPVSGIDSI